MELAAEENWVRVRDTHRLISTRYPPHGILDEISTPEELSEIFDLESWTNDRLQSELGRLETIPKSQWVMGAPNASVVMAAFCHPHVNGGRFTSAQLGGWYAALDIETAHCETIRRRAEEVREVGGSDLVVHVRDYLADFDCALYDVRDREKYAALYDPTNHEISQTLGSRLRESGANGIYYSSVRRIGGECLVAFKPPLVLNVRQGPHFEYRWEGAAEPIVQQLKNLE